MAAGLQMPQNSLTLVVDENGMYYRIPLCVINDPLNFNADHLAKKLVDKKAPKEIILKVSNYLRLHLSVLKLNDLLFLNRH